MCLTSKNGSKVKEKRLMRMRKSKNKKYVCRFEAIYFGRCLALAMILSGVANRPRFGCSSQLPTEAINVGAPESIS
jgi:hypothetical protein